MEAATATALLLEDDDDVDEVFNNISFPFVDVDDDYNR